MKPLLLFALLLALLGFFVFGASDQERTEQWLGRELTQTECVQLLNKYADAPRFKIPADARDTLRGCMFTGLLKKEIRPMSLKKRERDELVKQIKDEAIRLYQYRDELEVKGDDSVVRSMRQAVIDNDLEVIRRFMRELAIHTGVDTAWLNNT